MREALIGSRPGALIRWVVAAGCRSQPRTGSSSMVLWSRLTNQ